MIVTNEANYKAECVFKSVCNHAPATHTAYHEFANYPPKPICAYHAEKIRKMMAKGKR